MSVKEFYESIGSDYERVLKTLMNDSIATKYALRFIDDDSYNRLKKAVENEDIRETFSVSHALKGVAANIGLYKLATAVSNLCEQARPLEGKPDKALFNQITVEYTLVMRELKKFKDSL